MMICAIIVSFNPERKSFIALLRNLSPQVDRIVVVDNSPPENNDVLQFCQTSGTDFNQTILLVRLGDNLGIAAALNIGIQKAQALNADFVLLSDQDSLPEAKMVNSLHKAYSELIARGICVGVVGPTFTDLHTGLTYPFQVRLPKRFFYGHKMPTKEEPQVEALTMITSGSLIPLDVIKEVGLMREDLFIDMVDCEWCHRARWKGYSVYGTGLATMYHRMGEHKLRIWYLRWRYESAYSPLRIYYRMRNFVALWKPDFIEWRWKVRSSWYGLGIVYAHVLFGEYPLATLKMACKGIWHGLIGKMGRFSG